jgi:hypothetical protein
MGPSAATQTVNPIKKRKNMEHASQTKAKQIDSKKKGEASPNRSSLQRIGRSPRATQPSKVPKESTNGVPGETLPPDPPKFDGKANVQNG